MGQVSRFHVEVDFSGEPLFADFAEEGRDESEKRGFVWKVIFPRKRVEGLLLLFGFMVLGGFEVDRGFIAEGRVQPGSIIEAFDVVENHEFGLLSGFWKR